MTMSRADQLIRIKCSSRACGWVSPEMTHQQEIERGVPWYCDECGNKVTQYVCYTANERDEAQKCLASTAPAWVREHLGQLRGKNLACWCGIDQPCHRNVLLELANAAP